MKKILIIDNDSDAVLIVTYILKGVADVTSVKDPREGVSLAINGNYNAVISEIMLPGRDGFWVLKNIKNLKPNVPVIAFTTQSHLKKQILEKGFDDLIEKPSSFKKFLSKISKYL